MAFATRTDIIVLAVAVHPDIALAYTSCTSTTVQALALHTDIVLAFAMSHIQYLLLT